METTGGLSRVIARRPAPRTQAQADEPAPSVGESVEATVRPTRSLDRPAARLAARRRRRTLLTLLTATVVVGALAGFAVIAPYYVAAPVALVVAWLVACRVQVRRERGIVTARPARTKADRPTMDEPKVTRPKASRPKLSLAKLVHPKLPQAKAPRQATAADEEDTVIVSGQFEDIDPGRKHQMEDVPLEVDALDDQVVIAVPSIATTGEALWDPLPVTLPTYVTKPRAGRTVRTIDFSQPHTWTSGHIEGEDVELPKRDDDAGDERRAVGH
ncbi:MAG: hypothetical protein ABW075_11295 [Aeromicrobium sp.]